jgi:Zn-finger nucleic acid-binding protein
MSDAWDERRKAQEESYFESLNKQALERLAAKKQQPARPSPVTGMPMEVVTVMGTVIDRCVVSGGIWLDAGELEQLLVASKDNTASLEDFINLVPSLTPSNEPVTGGKNSPITGKPMNQEKILGVSIDKCAESGGIWLDASELQRLLNSSHQSLSSGIKDFFALVLGRNS